MNLLWSTWLVCCSLWSVFWSLLSLFPRYWLERSHLLDTFSVKYISTDSSARILSKMPSLHKGMLPPLYAHSGLAQSLLLLLSPVIRMGMLQFRSDTWSSDVYGTPQTVRAVTRKGHFSLSYQLVWMPGVRAAAAAKESESLRGKIVLLVCCTPTHSAFATRVAREVAASRRRKPGPSPTHATALSSPTSQDIIVASVARVAVHEQEEAQEVDEAEWDLEPLINHFIDVRGAKAVAAVGVSSAANGLVQYAASSGASCRLSSVMIVSHSFAWQRCAMKARRNPLYQLLIKVAYTAASVERAADEKGGAGDDDELLTCEACANEMLMERVTNIESELAKRQKRMRTSPSTFIDWEEMAQHADRPFVPRASRQAQAPAQSAKAMFATATGSRRVITEQTDPRNRVESKLNALFRSEASEALISSIDIPLLAIHAEDDPVIPFASVPLDKMSVNPRIITVVAKNGGHGGFFESFPEAAFAIRGGWLPSVALEFTRAALPER